MNDKDATVRPVPGKKKSYRWVILLVGGVLLIFVLFNLLSNYIEEEIGKRIALLNGKTSDIDVQLLTGSCEISNLEIGSITDSLNVNQYALRLNTLSVKGINLYELMVNKKIMIRNVILDSGAIHYSKVTQLSHDSIQHSEYKFFSIDKLSFINLKLNVQLDTALNYTALFNGQFDDMCLRMDSLNKFDYTLSAVNTVFEKIAINSQHAKYRAEIGRIHFNTAQQTITMDSALLIPTQGKYEFAKQLGEQTARVEMLIPQVVLEGVKFEEIRDGMFVASKMMITSFDLSSFKDKRIPFLRTRNIPLPMMGFLKFPYHVQLDSIVIRDGTIRIEEFPENAKESYRVEFKNVNATLAGLSNRFNNTGSSYAVMEASGNLMNTGKVKATFKFPLDGSPTYYAKGSISHLAFVELNPLLKMANVRIESGYLNMLTFNFNYTDFNSKGKLEVDYQDLQLISLDKNMNTTNQFRTVLMNMFFKNSMNQFKSLSKRTGIIDIERDRKRYIFNVWIKSILDGFKSSILGLDKQAHTRKKKSSKKK
jgi:hypothetical protein